MNPKSGKAGSPISPAAPEEPKEADSAEPGQSIEGESGGGKSAEPEKPYKQDEEKTGWIEIELVDEEDRPVAGERYKVMLPDGSVKEGTLNQNGFARIEGIDPGSCKVAFPNLDKDAWERGGGKGEGKSGGDYGKGTGKSGGGDYKKGGAGESGAKSGGSGYEKSGGGSYYKSD